MTIIIIIKKNVIYKGNLLLITMVMKSHPNTFDFPTNFSFSLNNTFLSTNIVTKFKSKRDGLDKVALPCITPYLVELFGA